MLISKLQVFIFFSSVENVKSVENLEKLCLKTILIDEIRKTLSVYTLTTECIIKVGNSRPNKTRVKV